MAVKQISLRFKTALSRSEVEPLFNKWVLFHRWLPDGPSDAIEHHFGDEGVNVALWFERRGVFRNGMIEFDAEHTDVPADKVDCQAVLESGPLVGEITIDEVNETLWDAIRDQKKGDAEYGPFGKKCPIFSFEHVSHTTSKEQTAHQWWSLRHGL